MREGAVRDFLADISAERRIADQAPRSSFLHQLVDAVELGYVVVHPPYSGYAPIRHYLEMGLSLEKFYDHGGVIGYRIVDGMDH